MKLTYWIIPATLLIMSGCIGDDIIFDAVEESVRIQNPIDSLGVGDMYMFEAAYFNQIGVEENATIKWESADTNIVQITQEGMATGIALGTTHLRASVSRSDKEILDSLEIIVGMETGNPTAIERTGMLQTSSSYVLEGSFTLKMENGSPVLSFAEDYQASSALPGLYVYLSNNANSTNEAFEIGEVKVFSGAHSYTLPSSIELNQYAYVLYYCKPFRVKVGDGPFDN